MSTHGVHNAFGTFIRSTTTYSQPLRKSRRPSLARPCIPQYFHSATRLAVVKPYLLADIGEGITECQIIQWFVQPGARVAQFDKICEVQSDKAAVEITSRFDGIIKKLHYEADDMARVGKPLVDIDIQSEISPEDEALINTSKGSKEEEKAVPAAGDHKTKTTAAETTAAEIVEDNIVQSIVPRPSGKHASLATPAVRHLTKQHNIDILDISGTGKDGRVLKEDVQNHMSNHPSSTTTASTPSEPLGQDKPIPFTPVQRKMYETMTRSLSIPHFLYSDLVDFTSLSTVRRALNSHPATQTEERPQKLSALPFIIKAVSLSLNAYPSLNAHLDTTSDKPQFIHKASHNIGFAVDTPSGLLVPVIRSVQSHSITSLAAEINRLSALARSNKLAASDFTGATFTVSNIGSIGGLTVAPVIVGPQVAILGVGKARVVPAFAADGSVVRKEEGVFSWSADHRVVDGATVARCAEMVRGYLERVERMMVKMR
ncbi:hypothetical protein EJ08DRAFT_606499 [Tothia fuscella]|uniref:Dihydrolipoamide acetyltransferase component of pyruvate dehydrogenase complex n=1 Tax=Tothia fuscella TaxID=1048955 RepID=A0A9P4NYD2_9PEZI|nr:hypothetical protein EJ08DRAFT_606499 [Tothia fuscella]